MQWDILGIDYGKKYIGTALGNLELNMAVPLEVVSNDSEVMHTLIRVLKKEQIQEVVIGRPLSLEASETPMTHEVEAWADRFSRVFSGKVFFEDERMTTAMAEKSKDRGNRERVDAVSAQHILESYLEKKRKQTTSV